MNLKKVLGAVLSAVALTATMSMGAMAESATVNLMPADISAITCGEGGTVEKDGSSVVFKAGAADTSFTYAIGTQVDMTETDYLYFGINATGGWDIKWASSALNNPVNPGISADFGGTFGKDGNPGENQYGTLIEAGSYAPGEVEILASGAYTWNSNLPDDGIVTVTSIEVRVGANSQVTLSALYFGDVDAAEATPAAPTTNDGEAPAATTAAPANTTTKKTSPATGESTAMVASGIVLAVVSAGAVALTMKKKAQ